MARGTAGTNTQISGIYTSHLGLTNFTMAGWIRRPSSVSMQSWGFAELAAHRTQFLHFWDNRMYFVVANGANVSGHLAANVTGWHHWALVFDGSQGTDATRLKGFYDGAQQTLTLGTIPSTISSNASNETFRVGRATANNAWSTGDFADLAMWDATLTDAEVASLADGFSADKISPANLLAYLPLVRDIQDVVSATTLTDASTTVEPHPRIYA